MQANNKNDAPREQNSKVLEVTKVDCNGGKVEKYMGRGKLLKARINAVESKTMAGPENEQLHEMQLTFKNLHSIPDSVLQMKHLINLNLSHNSIKVLPDDIKYLRSLIWLDLSFNELETLPHSLSGIPQLKYLNISHNNFKVVPYVLYNALQFIRILDISFNLISNFNEPPNCFINLEELNLSHNNLDLIPKWVFDAKSKINAFNISHNSLSRMTTNFLQATSFVTPFTSLKLLNLQNCKLTQESLNFLPNFTNLETLNISNTIDVSNDRRNYLLNLDMDFLVRFVNFKYLYGSGINLSTLPDNFGYLNFIQYLDLANNLLTWLPNSFCNILSLKVCKLDSNLIYFLPAKFGNLINLQKVFLSHNNLTDLPDSFQSLENLEFCDLYCNKIDQINLDIVNMKSLKGIDLECNCLVYDKLCENSETVEEFHKKYSPLKQAFRLEMNVDTERVDFQDLRKDESEAAESRYNDNTDYESDTFVHNEPTEEVLLSCVEKWDGENTNNTIVSRTEYYDFEDNFDPNVNYEALFKEKRKSQVNNFAGNFCPGDTHVPSLRKYFMWKTDYVTVEGQYEMD